MSLLIVGCGYVGTAIAKNLLQSNKTVFALTRSDASAQTLDAQGICPLVGHWLQSETLPELPRSIEAIVVGVPHREDPVCQLPPGSDQHHALGLANLMKWASAQQPLPKLVYMSTTGVFGATQAGQVVDEDSPISPTRVGPKIAAAAESWLTENKHLWQSTTLRLAGIYGPGRIPLLSTLQQRLPLAVVKDGMLNLIHLDDIAQAVLWAVRSPNAEALYLLSDGQPTKREDFYKYLAAICQLPDPIFTDADPESSRAARATDKQIDSKRFWSHSNLNAFYPSYQEGLKNCTQGLGSNERA